MEKVCMCCGKEVNVFANPLELLNGDYICHDCCQLVKEDIAALYSVSDNVQFDSLKNRITLNCKSHFNENVTREILKLVCRIYSEYAPVSEAKRKVGVASDKNEIVYLDQPQMPTVETQPVNQAKEQLSETALLENTPHKEENKVHNAQPWQGYAQPRQGYAQPQQRYVQPQQTYAQPQQRYVQPQQTYAQPQQRYVQPQQTYAQPQQTYAQPYGYAPVGSMPDYSMMKPGLRYKAALIVFSIVILISTVFLPQMSMMGGLFPEHGGISLGFIIEHLDELRYIDMSEMPVFDILIICSLYVFPLIFGITLLIGSASGSRGACLVAAIFGLIGVLVVIFASIAFETFSRVVDFEHGCLAVGYWLNLISFVISIFLAGASSNSTPQAEAWF